MATFPKELLRFQKSETLSAGLKGSLNTYRFCDNVWTFVLNDVEFREVTELDKVKIVACEWDLSGGQVAKTLCSQCRGSGFDPWSGN